jgi:adenosylhomocysteinase
MDQFTVPQFIDVEDKIFGPITTRQFLILLATGLILFIAFKLADIALFIFLLVVMGGFAVMSLNDAARTGDIFVTVTGCSGVVSERHMTRMKDGAIVANSGHFDVEIDLAALKRLSRSHRVMRQGIDQYVLRSGRRINVLGEGRLVNLACAEGHPPSVMDLSFANQALSCEYLSREGRRLARKVYPVPEAIDREIAALKLKALGVSVDTLSAAQQRYLASWELGT